MADDKNRSSAPLVNPTEVAAIFAAHLARHFPSLASFVSKEIAPLPRHFMPQSVRLGASVVRLQQSIMPVSGTFAGSHGPLVITLAHFRATLPTPFRILYVPKRATGRQGRQKQHAAYHSFHPASYTHVKTNQT
jgi:hypothetical protein